MQHGGDHWWVCIFFFFFFCFFKDKISIKQRHIQSSKHLKQGLVRFDETSVPDFLLQLLHRTRVGTLFVFRSSASAPTVGCSGGAGRSAPIGLVGSDTGLHNPIYTYVRIHCNIGYCTTLLHNKDVTLNGFLRGCRLTRLNHVTLVFSVFLFYASHSVSTLAYTTWYNTSRC